MTKKVFLLAGLAALITLKGGFAQTEFDFRSFKGNYRGPALIRYGSDFEGRARLRVRVSPTGRQARIVIRGSVESNKVPVAINNQLRIDKAGNVIGKELAPGVTSGRRFKASSEVADGVFTFASSINLGSAAGRIEGSFIRDEATGVITLVYSLYVGTDVSPVYTYQCVGNPPGSSVKRPRE